MKIRAIFILALTLGLVLPQFSNSADNIKPYTGLAYPAPQGQPAFKIKEMLGAKNQNAPQLKQIIEAKSITPEMYAQNPKAVDLLLDAARFEGAGLRNEKHSRSGSTSHLKYLNDVLQTYRTSARLVLERALSQSHKFKFRFSKGRYEPLRKESAKPKLSKPSTKKSETGSGLFKKTKGTNSGQISYKKDMTVFGLSYFGGLSAYYLGEQIFNEHNNPRKIAELFEALRDPAMMASVVPIYFALRWANGNKPLADWKIMDAQSKALQASALNLKASTASLSVIKSSLRMSGFLLPVVLGSKAIVDGAKHRKTWMPIAKACFDLRYERYKTQDEALGLQATCDAGLEAAKNSEYFNEMAVLSAGMFAGVLAVTTTAVGTQYLKGKYNQLMGKPTISKKTQKLLRVKGSVMNQKQIQTLTNNLGKFKAHKISLQISHFAKPKIQVFFKWANRINPLRWGFSFFVFEAATHFVTPHVQRLFAEDNIWEPEERIERYVKSCSAALFNGGAAPTHCTKQEILADMQEHATFSNKWRAYSLAKPLKSQMDWLKYYSELQNKYKASQLIYSQVAKQIDEYQKKYGPYDPQKNSNDFVGSLFGTMDAYYAPNATKETSPEGITTINSPTQWPMYTAAPFYGVNPLYRVTDAFLNLKLKILLENDEFRKKLTPQAIKELENQRDRRNLDKMDERNLAELDKIANFIKGEINKNLKNYSAATIKTFNSIATSLSADKISEKTRGLYHLNEIRKFHSIPCNANNPNLIPINYTSSKKDKLLTTMNANLEHEDCLAEKITYMIQDPDQDPMVTLEAVMPLPPGGAYYKNFETFLRTQGIGTEFKPNKYLGLPTASMTDYIVKSLICGKPANQKNQDLFHEKWGFGLNFQPPKMSTYNGPLCKVFSAKDKNDYNIYSQIKDPAHHNGYFLGATEVISKFIDPNVLNGGFENWWNSNVEQEYIDILAKAKDIYINKIVKEDFIPRLYSKKTSYGLPTGTVPSLTRQLQFYIQKVFDPIFANVYANNPNRLQNYNLKKQRVIDLYHLLTAWALNDQLPTAADIDDTYEQLAMAMYEFETAMGFRATEDSDWEIQYDSPLGMILWSASSYVDDIFKEAKNFQETWAILDAYRPSDVVIEQLGLQERKAEFLQPMAKPPSYVPLEERDQLPD